MHNSIETMLKQYNCKTIDDYKNALKEIIQEIALLGLYRADFFNKAAFYGGSCLRIFHSLNRFSEDLDFSLLDKDTNFDIEHYCKYIKDELGSFGFEMKVEKKSKIIETNIESAFIKGGTRIQLMNISSLIPNISKLHKNEIIKVKIEVDTVPPGKADYEVKYQLVPIPYHVRTFDLPSLFAGKVHAILCRNWGESRIKGRDLYDFVWYLSQGTKINIIHLSERMKQTKHLLNDEVLTMEKLKRLLTAKFEEIDYKAAKADVSVFIKDLSELDLWSKEFFVSIIKDRLA